MATQDLLFGYLGWIQSGAHQTSVAALLVTNHRGLPVEFRYTEPVEVTELQRMLYPQESLNETLATTLGRSLWNATERKPRLLLAEDALFACFWESLPSSEQGIFAYVEVAPDPSYQMPERKGSVVMPVEAGCARLLRMQLLPERDEVVELARHVFSEASEKMRLDEPFERVEAILKALHRLPQTETRRRSALPIQPPSHDATEALPRSEQPVKRPRAFEENRVSRQTLPPPVRPQTIVPMRRIAPTPDEVPLEPELTSEAIQERLRRFGVRNESHAERLQRLQRLRAAAASSAQQEGPFGVDGDVRANARQPLQRSHPDDDTDLEMVTPHSHRSETEVQRWKERFSAFKRPQTTEEPEWITPDYSRIQRTPRTPVEPAENISHLTKLDSLRSRRDLQWLRNREGRS